MHIVAFQLTITVLNIVYLKVRYGFMLHVPKDIESFSHFAEKLDSKGQGTVGIEESYQAIYLLLPYYSNGVPDGELIYSSPIMRVPIIFLRKIK